MAKSTCHQGFLSTKTHCSNLGFRTMIWDMSHICMHLCMRIYFDTYYIYIYICTYSSIQYISLTCQIGPCFSQHHRVPKSYPNYRPLMHRREWQNHQATGFSELFPGIDLRLLTLSQNFRRVNRRFSRKPTGDWEGSRLRKGEGAIWGNHPWKIHVENLKVTCLKRKNYLNQTKWFGVQNVHFPVCIWKPIPYLGFVCVVWWLFTDSTIVNHPWKKHIWQKILGFVSNKKPKFGADPPQVSINTHTLGLDGFPCHQVRIWGKRGNPFFWWESMGGGKKGLGFLKFFFPDGSIGWLDIDCQNSCKGLNVTWSWGEIWWRLIMTNFQIMI